MQISKKSRTFQRRMISLLTLALILAPMAALAVYAGSAANDFSLGFNGAASTDYDRAYKSDVGSSTGGYAQANVTGAYLNGGRVTMWVEKINGTRVTDSVPVTGECTRYLYYYTGSLVANGYVDLTATLVSSSGGGISGIWWP